MKIEMNFNKSTRKMETSIEVGQYVAETPQEMLDLLDTEYEGRKMPENIIELYACIEEINGLTWYADLKNIAFVELEVK